MNAGFIQATPSKENEEHGSDIDGTSKNTEEEESENRHSNEKHKTNDSENGEVEDDDEWAPIHAIPDSSFIALARRLNSADFVSSVAPWIIEKRIEGSFNHAVILANGSTKVVIKVPIVATEKRWQAPHAQIMRSAAHTMTYIKSKLPHFPVPGVILCDTSFENEINAPFVAETFMSGKAAWDIWYEKDEDGLHDYNTADFPSEEREKWRTTFLQSLAKTMAQLHSLEFDQIGMMQFKDNDPTKPTILPYHGWHEREDAAARVYFDRDVCTTAAEYYAAQLREKCFPKEQPKFKALLIIMESIFQSKPFNISKKHDDDEKETFTFLHEDLALQNILCSDTGEVTGIIDWDRSSTVPRCVGFSNVPILLQEDWSDDYVVCQNYIHSPWTLNKYRKVYADSMIEACGPDSDAKYTKISHIYGVIQNMLFGDHGEFLIRVESLVEKLLVEIPELRRVDIEPFLEVVGAEDGWEEAELVLREGIPRVLDYRNF
ncbi:hypothetical protein K505DRAFT_242786 [Melanomma pulvis-pyrius CBS 109.77]|uniref:Aminoglycoside phosphotransferase domain-containing protein n=1 Tax=Melanomma pulvis-pyrius CBS 109.77 TaxID=1314802 RepID=A0A6A6XDP6_9PLEO|nr:hypothetical protein K505DRAFT_242786 [Melanomma pulvis-pyrius CBS 109.77]